MPTQRMMFLVTQYDGPLVPCYERSKGQEDGQVGECDPEEWFWVFQRG